MTDRIPGSSYDNPIWYRGYRIHVGDTVFTPYVYAHDSYDGAPDSGDHRCGYANTVMKCKAEIDELES